MDLKKYSLILEKDSKVLFTSDKPRLRPLVECILENKERKNCKLYDRVIGLAAARLIVYSGIISSIETPVASIAGIEHLKKNGISISAEKTVEMILNDTKTGQCPMEMRAKDAASDAEYFLSLKKMMFPELR